MRKNLDTAKIMPLPVLMVGTYDKDGNADVMNVAWGGQCGPKHIALNLGLAHKTVENLKEKEAFTVSFATKGTEELSDYFGLRSGNDADKIAESGVNVIKAEKVDAPIIEEYPLTVEFKVIEMKETLGELRVVGEAVNVSADESILYDDGNISIEKLESIKFDSVTNSYRVIGEVVGSAFSDGKNLFN